MAALMAVVALDAKKIVSSDVINIEILMFENVNFKHLTKLSDPFVILSSSLSFAWLMCFI